MLAAAAVALVAGLACTLTAAGCGGNDSSPTAAPASCRQPSDARAALKALRSRSNEILDCGVPGFKQQIAALSGYPIVVNKWASWCGPCRFEFPFFRRLAETHAGKVAF